MESHPPFALTPWVRRLLAVNAVVYLLTITVFTSGWLFDAFAFAPSTAVTQPWTFVTYMFLHGGFLHLAFNMLMLFFFGPAVEERMGGRAFIWFYLLCGLGGAVLSFAIALFAHVAPFVGASGAIFGVALAFALNWPDAPIYVFPLPVPIKAKWLVFILAAIDLALAMSGASDGVAHLAHLGGFAVGFLYLRGEALLPRPASPAPERRTPAPALRAHNAGEAARRREPRRHANRRNAMSQADIDRLLDNISAKGIESLTPE
jgi:membrane associated rhomboid family serine protease